jgi:hypothetical protein
MLIASDHMLKLLEQNCGTVHPKIKNKSNITVDLPSNGSLIDDISRNQLALIIEGLFYDVVSGLGSGLLLVSAAEITSPSHTLISV